MFTLDDVTEKSPLFLVELYLQTQGDPSVTVSWFDIGETLGLDREASTMTAENLFATGLAEIKTLSGGIGITADGVAEAQQLGASITSKGDSGLVLGNTPVLNEAACQAVEKITADLKNNMGEKRLDFDSLSELMADLKSIDAQMSSPNSKTAIIRECFRSIMGVLKKTGDTDSLIPLKILLGD
ncbi:hypothetical protein BuS5_02119 [Desulfosarcina sp. BuS5]|uniref:hypothetical protein n=1 Tax=Desulfosarcina sp. BuS5 TaxID=933262 RepID=UPI00048A0A98|nr:hypothetical protein [Desulfosarcina sp. BuS5]WDN89151.1 hypothetical protein BuS5_02119 [Desulfosarcina sp. BuS5]